MQEFRKHNNKKGRGHPALIYKKVRDNYIYIGITHAEITRGMKNIALNVNPNPKDKRKAYIKPKPDKDNKSTFGKKEKGWKIDTSDRDKIEKIKKTRRNNFSFF